MSDEKALVPIEQKTVNFQGDEITAVLLETEEGEQVFVPVRPICDFLGLSWAGQAERINRDLVLSEVVATVRVTRTEGQREVTRELLALPLEFINGFLFGINASRVKEEIRENLIRYQRVFTELYRRFGVSSYKDIPKGKYKAVMEFLDDWHRRATQ